jgi:hypothetical protein
MEILLTRLTDDRHRLEILRADGSRDGTTLKTPRTMSASWPMDGGSRG